MPDAPDRAELEAAIYRHFSLQPARETTEAVIVKVAELEPVTWPPDSKQLRAGLFLSVPFLGGDRTKLDLAPTRRRRSPPTFAPQGGLGPVSSSGSSATGSAAPRRP